MMKSLHDRNAPYWAGAMVIFGVAGVSSLSLEWGEFWKSYVLDMTGPAWNYILFRGLFTGKSENVWTRFFKPTTTFFIFILVSFGVETAQYFNLYDATFDPWDLLAYISLLTPLFLIDLIQRKKDKE